MQIGNFITALRTGWILKNPETWKNRQVAVNTLAGLMSASAAIAKAFGYALPITDDQLVALAGGVWAAVSMFNSWATVATTDKVGLPPQRSNIPSDDAGSGLNG